MNQEKNIQKISKENKIDKVGETNIHPVSEMENASDDSVIRTKKSLGNIEHRTRKYNFRKQKIRYTSII